VRRPDVPIVGDVRLVIEELVRVLERRVADGQPDRSAWRQTLSGWQERFPLSLRASPSRVQLLKPQFVLEQLRDRAPEGTIVATGVGQHQMWTSQYWRFTEPYTWVCSGGLGTMGFSIPAAIGAKAGMPERTVWAVDGDGCFQMTAQELVTATTERIPVKIAILNNAYLGMVRQWQEMFYDERYSEVYLSPDLPDYVKWAEAMGCVAIRVESPEEVGPAIRGRTPINDRPVVIEFRTDAAEKVFPMVPAGLSQQRHRGRPTPRRDGAVTSNGARHHLLSVLVENKAGVLARVASLFARRGYNIYSLAVAPTDDERFSRITIVADADRRPRADREAAAQAGERHQDQRARSARLVERELMLCTVRADPTQRPGHRAGSVFGGRIVDVGHDELTVSVDDVPRASTISRTSCRPSASRCAANRTRRAAQARPGVRARPLVGGFHPWRLHRVASSSPPMANVYYEKDADRSLIAIARWRSSGMGRRAMPTRST
jgi:acetolactate synthase small subunit